MPCSSIERDRELRVGKPFDDVARFQVVLAVSILREPPGRRVVYEGIVKRLALLAAERGDVANGGVVEEVHGETQLE